MLHPLKRWITQNVINRSPTLKRAVFTLHSRYVNRRTKREAMMRIKSLKAEEKFDFSDTERRNVLIIAVDCMRFKSTSLAGYERDTTPFLKEFGKAYRAVTGAPWTYPSVPTILSGLYPTRHGAYIHSKIKQLDYLENVRGIRRSVVTLPELLLYIGYDVYMATSIELSSLHFRKRIPDIRWYPGETRAERVLGDFMNWLRKRNKKSFFAYIHLGDPHEPLNPPERYWNHFGEVKRLKNITRWDYTRPEEWKKPGFQEYVYNRVLLYDNTLRYVNDMIEELIGKMDSMGVLDDTLVVITADHGEEFWEHAEVEAQHFYDPRGGYGFGHGHNVFREVAEIPVVLHGFSHLKDHEIISSADITPTILTELNITPKIKLDGRALQEEPKKGRVLLTEAAGYGYEKKALYWREFKFLYAPDDGVKWVFNLKKDPNEQKPITDPEIAEMFEQKIKK
ncbi:sulfatase, partial [Thermococcus sp.]